MAEKEKTELVDLKLESEDGKGNTGVKNENGVVKSPGKHLNGSEEPSSPPVSGKEKGPDQKAKVNGVERSPDSCVNGAEESPVSSGKEAAMEKVKELKEQTGEKTGGNDEKSKPEAEQDNEEPEGSRFFGYRTRFAWKGGTQSWC